MANTGVDWQKKNTGHRHPEISCVRKTKQWVSSKYFRVIIWWAVSLCWAFITSQSTSLLHCPCYVCVTKARHNSSGSSLLFACSVGDHSNTDLTEKCSKLYGSNQGLDDHSTPCINFLISHIPKWMTTYTTKVTRFVNLLKMNYFYLGFWSIQSQSKMGFFTNYNLNRCYNSEFL